MATAKKNTNVKLTHGPTGREVEVPEESAGPYEELGWERAKARTTQSTPAEDKPAEDKAGDGKPAEDTKSKS